MSRRKEEGSVSPVTLTDLQLCLRERKKVAFGGPTYQAWSRIIDALETALLVQDAIAAAAADASADAQQADRSLTQWITAGAAR